MLGFARSLARQRQLDLPEEVEADYDACRRFLDAHAPSRPSGGAGRRSRTPARRPAPEVGPEPGGGTE
jgi:DNA topoisomerase-3